MSQETKSGEDDEAGLTPELRRLVFHHYNDQRDLFEKYKGKFYKQHRVYDLLVHNITKLWRRGVTVKDLAGYFDVQPKTMTGFLRRNGYDRLFNLFRTSFFHYKMLDVSDKREISDYENVGPDETVLENYNRAWNTNYPGLARNSDLNVLTTAPFDVETAGKILADRYEDVELAWEDYLESTGLSKGTYMDFFVYFNNPSPMVRDLSKRIDRAQNQLYELKEMVEGGASDEDIREYIEDLEVFSNQQS